MERERKRIKEWGERGLEYKDRDRGLE